MMADAPPDPALAAHIASLPWFHSIRLPCGLVTPGLKTLEDVTAEERVIFDAVRVAGHSVLDIGAWNGAFSFAAERHGAARVLATDRHTWIHPHWRGREAFNIVHAQLGSKVLPFEVDPMEVTGALGVYDVVLFLGVFYHLFDPIEVMRRLRKVTGGVLVVETHQDALDQSRPMMVFYPGDSLLGDATNWWGPNLPLVLHLLLELGFTRVMYRDHPKFGAARGFYVAFLPGAEERIAHRFEAPWTDLTRLR
jgi:tRNA (mo5U34)-methyltransferase